MASKAAAVEMDVAGHTVRLSSPDKVYFAERGYTKHDVFSYYLSVGDGILRALHRRPTTLQRFPDGLDGEMFFQKRVPTRGVPPWIETVDHRVPVRADRRRTRGSGPRARGLGCADGDDRVPPVAGAQRRPGCAG